MGTDKPLVGSAEDIEVPWWKNDLSTVLRPETRKMLKYAGVPEDDLISHIEQTRKRAWEIAPYPSIGSLTWLNSYLLLHEAHDTILNRLKDGPSILDCGCMVAPDLRQLAYEGAPTEDMFAFDIEPGFFKIGYDFYQDKGKFKTTFFAADGTKDLDNSPLGRLQGKLDIIWCPKFLHLFDRATQIKTAAKLVKLLKPQPGSMFAGSQNGYPKTLEAERAPGMKIWMGNAESLKADWDEVARLTDTRWDVQARLLDLRTIGLHKDDDTPYSKLVGYNLQWTATML